MGQRDTGSPEPLTPPVRIRLVRVWHDLFGHKYETDFSLPIRIRVRYDTNLIADVETTYFYSRCSNSVCSRIEQHYVLLFNCEPVSEDAYGEYSLNGRELLGLRE